MKFLIALLLVAAVQAAPKLTPRTQYLPTIGKARKLPSPRIINGEQAELGLYPHQVAIYLDSKQFCGGALISSTYIITAAHCTADIDTFEAIAGVQSLKKDVDTRQTIISRTSIAHEKYDSDHLTNDISLIKLPSAFLYTKYVEPINLPTYSSADDETYEGRNSIIAGWGTVVAGSDFINDELMYIRPQVISVSECQDVYGTESVTSTNICTSGTGSVGTCYGDSGSPVFVNITGGYTLIGISSFAPANGCAEEEPSGHTRVSAYLDWISDNSGVFINA